MVQETLYGRKSQGLNNYVSSKLIDMRSLQKVIVIATLLMVSIPCFSLDIGSGDTVFRYSINPFDFEKSVEVIYSDSIHESDEHDGLMFKILTDNTVEFFDYKDISIQLDTLVIPESVYIASRRYTVVGIGEECLHRNYYDLMFRPYNSDTLLSYFGPEYLYIPSTVKYISPFAFYQNVNLKTVVFNEGLESIGQTAFYACGITSIDIPSSVEFIADNAFDNCRLLETITVSSDNRYYDSRENCNAIVESKSDYMFVTSQKTDIPNSIRRVFMHRGFPIIRLTKESRCESLVVRSYVPIKTVDVRKCATLKLLEIAAIGDESNVDNIFFSSNLEDVNIRGVNIDNIKESPKKKRRNKGQENTFELKSVNYGEKSFVIIRRQGSERIGYQLWFN